MRCGSGGRWRKRFYPGLYYYLDVVRIDIPPLRHRQEDIQAALAEHFLTEADYPASFSVWGPGFADVSPRRHGGRFVQFDWPGNILQLAAVVAHAVMLAEGSGNRAGSVSAGHWEEPAGNGRSERRFRCRWPAG